MTETKLVVLISAGYVGYSVVLMFLFREYIKLYKLLTGLSNLLCRIRSEFPFEVGSVERKIKEEMEKMKKEKHGNNEKNV